MVQKWSKNVEVAVLVQPEQHCRLEGLPADGAAAAAKPGVRHPHEGRGLGEAAVGSLDSGRIQCKIYDKSHFFELLAKSHLFELTAK